jgi:aminomethyltransferase
MKTSLHQTHLNQAAKMVSFAGYEMPIQYPLGMLKEHEWVRSGNIGIFDVSHMGQFMLKGNSAQEFLNSITPTDFNISKQMQAKYTVLTNKKGGIIDDLIITKLNENEFFIVLNAGCKEKDKTWHGLKRPMKTSDIVNNLFDNLFKEKK